MALHYSEAPWTFTVICGAENPARFTEDPHHPLLSCQACEQVLADRARCMIFRDLAR